MLEWMVQWSGLILLHGLKWIKSSKQWNGQRNGDDIQTNKQMSTRGFFYQKQKVDFAVESIRMEWIK